MTDDVFEGTWTATARFRSGMWAITQAAAGVRAVRGDENGLSDGRVRDCRWEDCGGTPSSDQHGRTTAAPPRSQSGRWSQRSV